MKLVSFSAGKDRLIGSTDGLHVTCLTDRLKGLPADMMSLITRWPEFSEIIGATRGADYRLDEIRLHAPIARPGKIFGIGLNYADHVAESGIAAPAEQIWFTKAVTAVNGPYDPIQRPRVSQSLDYEGELVYVIGQRCRHVRAEAAARVIFGYCVGNDVSVRDWQLRTTQFSLGKSFDTHAPFGPWITTADEIDAGDCAIECFVNGERRQHSRTSQLIFGCGAQVAHLSQAMTLEPGDIIFTGTPGGVGAAMKPPAWLKAGDRVRVQIEGLGGIENEVIDEPALERISSEA